jgi:beta-galactosidase/beta-glucuronidase
MREIGRRGGRLMLNGRPLRLHGASLQEGAEGRGDALTPADADAVVARLKAIGANATRSQHPLSAELLDRLDAAGIPVWQGVGPVDAPGAWTSRTPEQRRHAVRRVRLNVLDARLHPSVLAWNLANEVAGNGHYGG